MHVAIADPSRTVAKCLTAILESHNHEVRSFRDGIEALDYIKSNQFVDVLIASSQLLSMTGPELCWETRLIAKSGRPLYIILMSSTEDRNNLVKALDGGADDFIRKPPVAEELAARLRAADRVVSMQRELQRNATTDSLTGVLNRRAFFANAREMCERADAGNFFSAVMLDVDHFKRINDSYGHGFGDDVLVAIAHEISEEGSTIGRLGGEEFAVLLDNAQLYNAVEIAESMRTRVRNLKFRRDSETISVTCSFGVSQWQSGDQIDYLLRRADVALYKAKTEGRDRVLSATSMSDSTNYDSLTSVVRSGDWNLRG
jgi:diguanylate cyclase (GGDEF)-like protein